MARLTQWKPVIVAALTCISPAPAVAPANVIHIGGDIDVDTCTAESREHVAGWWHTNTSIDGPGARSGAHRWREGWRW